MTQRWHPAQEVAELRNTIEGLRRVISALEDEASSLRTQNKLYETRNTFLVTQIADLNRLLTAAKKQWGYVPHG